MLTAFAILTDGLVYAAYLFIVAIGFLLLVCIYFSYELSRLEERTRVLAEELAILRAEREGGADASDEQLTP